MSRKTRRAGAGGRTQKRTPVRTAAPPPKQTITDPLAYYRGLAAPSMRMRLVLVGGLIAYIIAQLVALSSSKNLSVASDFAVVGMVGILLFLGSGFVRHQRALFRIRRENPSAWNTSMRYALSTLPIPLGFGGRPADSRERAIRWVTLLLLLAFAVTAIAGSSHH
jgi:hypothetical protein